MEKNNSHTANELFDIDTSFSALSALKGMKYAFSEYIAIDGVLLRSNNMPIIGKKAISEIFKDENPNFKLTWNPLFAEIAKSHDLGYTYGTYELQTNDGDLLNGTYVSIWKKDQKGAWRLALDSGNEGLDK